MTKSKELSNPVPVTLFEIAGELQAIIAGIIEAGGEANDETMAMLGQWNAALEAKAQNIAYARARLFADEEYYGTIEAAAHARRIACAKADRRLTGYLASAMKATGTKNIKEGGVFSISLIDGRASVRITDPGALPLDLVTTKIVQDPDKAAILKRLLAGETIPGAELEYGADYITIRGGK